MVFCDAAVWIVGVSGVVFPVGATQDVAVEYGKLPVGLSTSLEANGFLVPSIQPFVSSEVETPLRPT